MKTQEITVTAQGLFDATVLHLASQGRRSMHEHAIHCAYRGVDGMRCAVGFHFTDAEYDPKMEGRGVRCIDLPARLQPYVDLLSRLQAAHDNGEYQWADALRRVARTSGLNDRVVTAAFGA